MDEILGYYYPHLQGQGELSTTLISTFHRDGVWMNVMHNEAPVGGVENFAILVVD
jgi:hypothetical protein